MKNEKLNTLPIPLKELIVEIETFCGFEIALSHNPGMQVRGNLQHKPSSILIEHRDEPLREEVLAHELLHAKRYFNDQTPFMEFVPPRILIFDGRIDDIAFHLDNQLEHLFIIEEMSEKFGYQKDDTHVRQDLKACQQGIDDTFHLQCTLFCNWFLINFHFDEHIEECQGLLEKHGLHSYAEQLLVDITGVQDSVRCSGRTLI